MPRPIVPFTSPPKINNRRPRTAIGIVIVTVAAALMLEIVAAPSGAAPNVAGGALVRSDPTSGVADTRATALTQVRQVGQQKTTDLSTLSCGRSPRISSNFLGLSMEYWDFPKYMQPSKSGVSQLVAYINGLRSITGASTVLRIGGGSADFVGWGQRSYSNSPGITYNVTPAWFQLLSTALTATNSKATPTRIRPANEPRCSRPQ